MTNPPENPSPAETGAGAARIDFELACAHCATSLKGVPLDGECPACHNRIGTTLDRHSINLQTATVCIGLPCSQCDYDLRTLAINGVCPECGQPVIASLLRRPLNTADPAWRKRVLSGIHWLIFAGIGIPLALIPGVVSMSSQPNARSAFAGGTAAVEAVLLLIGLAGIVAASVRHPSMSRRDESRWPHTLARLSAIAAGVPILCGLGLVTADLLKGTPCLVNDYFLKTWPLWLPSGLVSMFSLVLCFHRIARRARNTKLARGLRNWLIFSGLTVATGAFNVLQGWFYASPIGANPPPQTFFLSLITFLFLAILCPLTLFDLFTYRKFLRSTGPATPPRV